MKTFIKNLLVVIVGCAILYGIYFYSQNLRGVGPAINPPSGDIADEIEEQNKLDKPAENATDFPLQLPVNFKIEVFAKNLSGARVIARSSYGFLVSRTSEGIITLLKTNDSGIFTGQQEDIIKNLRKPHGIVVDPQPLTIWPDVFEVIYIAEEHRISKYIMNHTNPGPTKIADLPTQGGGHFTRTLGLGPDGRLYVSIGSSCNVCDESDERRSAIYSMKPDGSDFKKFASGLRNTVFFTWNKDGKMWGTDMGRDLLGDNIPPEEINVIENGKNYGWPICFGNKIHDTNFDKKQYIRDPCADSAAPKVEMQAHSAPLGIAFIPFGFGPADWEGDLIVASHGSWNRTTPTGYKLVRVKLDNDGNYQGMEDFISGWLKGNSALGRPVDVIFERDSATMYVSDDKAGIIYIVSYTK